MEETLREAIQQHIEVEISSGGKTFAYHPHIIWSGKDGATRLGGYRLLSVGVYPPKKVWDEIAMLKISAVASLGTPFFVDPSFRAASKRPGDVVICHA